ncbi:alpha/beta hydrolase [Granulosicoccus sp.]|nr:alpha/beta hydrolase [Granulosicoccus sp.]MDB4224588.1 alpha/beta hydrolase [Granulosicoccus sp.]
MGKVAKLFLLPGMMCDERLFSSQSHALSELCICVNADFTHGESVADYAEQVIELIRSHGDTDSHSSLNILVGLSMGGIVLMECMRLAPELIDAVVLMDTNPFAEDATRRLLRAPQIQRALDGELETILIEEMKPLYLAPVNRSNEALLSLVLDMARKLGSDVFAKQSQALMNRRDNSEALASWKKPALILYGAHDHLCPKQRHLQMHELMPQSVLVEVVDAGHLPTLEMPEVVNDSLRSFVRSLQ